MSERELREHFEDAVIQKFLEEKRVNNMIEGRKELNAWKKANKVEYKKQYDDYCDEIFYR